MSNASKSYYGECQRELLCDPEYLRWLMMMDRKPKPKPEEEHEHGREHTQEFPKQLG